MKMGKLWCCLKELNTLLGTIKFPVFIKCGKDNILLLFMMF